ncbi:fluoride efflux transporter CrcB [Streptomyces sp. NPDC004008]
MTVPHPKSADRAGTPAPEPARAPSPWQGQGEVVAVVALGGAIGATARYAASLLWPARTGGFPWTTFGINIVGCAVIGVFMVVITEVRAAPRLVRPFFGTGVLGGFTTFSTYAVEIQRLVDAGEPRTALAYLFATLAGALAVVWFAMKSTRGLLAWRQR